MFICDKCHKVTKSGEPMTKEVTETRHREYRDEYNKVIGVGYETVKEIKICVECKNG